MALAISNAFMCPQPRIPLRDYIPKRPLLPSPVFSVRLTKSVFRRQMVVCASSAAGSPSPEGELNPYEVLGVNPFSGFKAVKEAYKKKRKEAESVGDETTAAQLEKAYDKLMMAQLANRKKGVTYGSFQVSKDIKYADKQPIVPWGPRFAKSSPNDMKINLAISAAFTVWILIKRNAEFKPLQFLAFAFVYRFFEKLKAYETPTTPIYTEYGEDSARTMQMGKRVLRSLSLVIGCIGIASLAYTGLLNLIEYMGNPIPALLYNNQELLVTGVSALMLYVLASYYR